MTYRSWGRFSLFMISPCSARRSIAWKLLVICNLIVSPVRMYVRAYYGLVVTPPRPQTFHRSRDNLKNHYQIASIFYMKIDIGERIAGKQDGPGPIIYGLPRPPPPPRIAKNTHFCILWPIYEKLVVIVFPCYTYVCSVMRSYSPEIFYMYFG